MSDMYSLGLILHFMLMKDLPDFFNNVEKEKFDIDLKSYSQAIYDICAGLLKKEP